MQWHSISLRLKLSRENKSRFKEVLEKGINKEEDGTIFRLACLGSILYHEIGQLRKKVIKSLSNQYSFILHLVLGKSKTVCFQGIYH